MDHYPVRKAGRFDCRASKAEVENREVREKTIRIDIPESKLNPGSPVDHVDDAHLHARTCGLYRRIENASRVEHAELHATAHASSISSNVGFTFGHVDCTDLKSAEILERCVTGRHLDTGNVLGDVGYTSYLQAPNMSGKMFRRRDPVEEPRKLNPVSTSRVPSRHLEAQHYPQHEGAGRGRGGNGTG